MKSKKLYLNSTIFLIIACVFVLATISIGIKNYQAQMQNQLIEIYESDLRSNSDSLVKIISNRISTAESAMHNIIGTYGTHTTNDFNSLITRSNYTNSMGKLTYYANYQLENIM